MDWSRGFIYLSFFVHTIRFVIIIMRSAGIYLVQAEIGTCKLALIPQGDIGITLRVGKTSASIIHTQQTQSKQANLNVILQLNVDSTGLQTQRCSITLSHNKQSQKKTIGIALISLPKDKNIIQNVYRLTQSQDKKSELQVKIKISLLDSSISSLNKPLNLPLNSTTSITPTNKQDAILQTPQKHEQSQIQSKILRNDQLSKNQNSSDKQSVIRSQPSIISDKDKVTNIEQNRKNLKGFKIKQNDRLIQITQSQLKMYKEQKQAYYQLYQIQKTKSQAATKFIATIIKKIGNKYPDLISTNNNDKMSKYEIVGRQKPVNKNVAAQQHAETVSKLEQANRSLHRQNEEYKRIVDQLRAMIFAKNKGGEEDINTLKVQQMGILSKKNSSSMGNLNLDLYDNKQKRQVGNVLPSNILQDEKKASTIVNPPSPLKDIDFKKWLELSIGQRNAIQKHLQNIPEKSSLKDEQSGALIHKLRKSIDKSFILFLNKKQVNKDAILTHKQEINRLIDQLNA